METTEKEYNNSLLFTPATIGPLALRNRTIRSAAFEGMAENYSPSEQLYQYHTSVAAGGIGMTTLAYASVSRSGLSFKTQLWMRPEIIPGLRRITDSIHAHSAAASIQLGHCGNMTHKSTAGQIPIGASSGFNLYSPTIVRGMSRKEIAEVAKDFGRAVKIARKAGFDAVEIHAGHGYLISQFLSPYTNHRHDEYGGSLDNRMRFMRECMNEVMTEARGDMAVIVKTNMYDGFKGGIEIPEALTIAKELERCGAHALVLSAGFVSRAPMVVMRGTMPLQSMTYYMHPWWLKYGVKAVGKYMIKSEPFKECYFLEDALKFRAELKLPLIYVGGIVSREGIEKVLGHGFQFVQMGRALINEPDFVNRMRDENRQRCGCDHVNYCIARMYSLDMVCHKHMPQGSLPPCILQEIEEIKKKG